MSSLPDALAREPADAATSEPRSRLATIRVAPLGLSLESATLNLGGPRCALCDTSIVIRPGEQLAVIGPSGAGKTTMLAVLGAALRPSAGRVLVDGTDPWRLGSRALRALRARLFIAPQVPPLPPRQRVVTAVLAGRLARWTLPQAFASLMRPADPALAHEALARFSLQDKLWERVDRLSGGERQRVGLARALIAEAGAVLIDEPLSALDPTLADQTIDVLVASARQRGATLVCSLHQVEQALAKFQRVIGLRDGNVVFDRSPSDISSDDVARLYHNRDDDPAAPADPMTDARTPASRASRCF